MAVFVWRCLLHVLPAVLVSHIRGCLQLGNLVSPSSYFLWVLQWFALLWRSLHIARLCPIIFYCGCYLRGLWPNSQHSPSAVFILDVATQGNSCYTGCCTCLLSCLSQYETFDAGCYGISSQILQIFFRASTNRILLMNLSRMWNKQVAISSFSLEQRNRSETVVSFLYAEEA